MRERFLHFNNLPIGGLLAVVQIQSIALNGEKTLSDPAIVVLGIPVIAPPLAETDERDLTSMVYDAEEDLGITTFLPCGIKPPPRDFAPLLMTITSRSRSQPDEELGPWLESQATNHWLFPAGLRTVSMLLLPVERSPTAELKEFAPMWMKLPLADASAIPFAKESSVTTIKTEAKNPTGAWCLSPVFPLPMGHSLPLGFALPLNPGSTISSTSFLEALKKWSSHDFIDARGWLDHPLLQLWFSAVTAQPTLFAQEAVSWAQIHQTVQACSSSKSATGDYPSSPFDRLYNGLLHRIARDRIYSSVLQETKLIKAFSNMEHRGAEAITEAGGMGSFDTVHQPLIYALTTPGHRDLKQVATLLTAIRPSFYLDDMARSYALTKQMARKLTPLRLLEQEERERSPAQRDTMQPALANTPAALLSLRELFGEDLHEGQDRLKTPAIAGILKQPSDTEAVGTTQAKKHLSFGLEEEDTNEIQFLTVRRKDA